MTAWGDVRRQTTSVASETAEVVVRTYEVWRADRCIRLGAGLAYYGLFALVPLLTLVVAIAGVVFSTTEVQDFIAEPLANLLGVEAADVAERLAEEVTEGGLVRQLGLIGAGSMLVAASVVFAALQDALNQIWAIPYEAGLGKSVRRRLLSFAVVLALGGALLTSLAAQTVVSILGGLLPGNSEVLGVITNVASGLLPLGVAAAALALLFALLPSAEVDKRAAAVAGTVTALVMALGAFAVGAYLRRFGASSAQGAAGSVFVVLTAIYAQSQILLAGAELSKVLTHRWQGPRRPDA